MTALAFIGSFAVALAAAWLVFIAVIVLGIGPKGGLEAFPGALARAIPAAIVTFAVVLWVLAQ